MSSRAVVSMNPPKSAGGASGWPSKRSSTRWPKPPWSTIARATSGPIGPAMPRSA